VEIENLNPSLVTTSLPLATIIPYSGNTNDPSRRALAKAGWLVCDGSAISRTAYKELYTVIGDIHGRGDALSTFNLPDYRGRFLRGVDSGAGRDLDSGLRTACASGGLTGDAVGSVQADSFGSHSHSTVQMIGDGNVDGVDSCTVNSGDHHNEGRQTSAVGGSETRPINAYVFWLILAGVPTAANAQS
jgi:phage-related tail fiber protein